VTIRHYFEGKEVDDVLGGADAWKNVDTTEGKVNVSIQYSLIFLFSYSRSSDQLKILFLNLLSE
jgi:DNA-directed RNA polymerase III subunit RPC11